MIVYRLEYKGIGPFNAADQIDLDALNDHIYEIEKECNWKKYPTMLEDFNKPYREKYHKNYITACISFDQLVYWFDLNLLDILCEKGFYIAEYEVQEKNLIIGYSKTQVFFDKKRSVLISKKNVYDYL